MAVVIPTLEALKRAAVKHRRKSTFEAVVLPQLASRLPAELHPDELAPWVCRELGPLLQPARVSVEICHEMFVEQRKRQQRRDEAAQWRAEARRLLR